ncbi:MAG TPA: Holliday junction branch migration protein RuvA [Leucothrix mucor]|uniref:Holliday junction branch migration complex subunit RuvA n=1 Tax=Leucothrix mucor TaxID=45248 RepID=A0A7V2T3C5_LEUMU|nr:Holliday junction branch migration protein RuvA [Leucothrix mucor]
MIGQLRGKLIHKQAPQLMLDVNGVGYELLASMTTFLDLPELDEETTLFTHFIVREDSQTLYAFGSKSERSLFRTLLKVNGVGPKMALAIVSGMTAQEFSQFIHAGDITALTRLPGVGKKTAERLIIEMRDRLPEVESTDTNTTSTPRAPSQKHIEDEAVTALLALGYKPPQASRMVASISQENLSAEEMIRLALKASLL